MKYLIGFLALMPSFGAETLRLGRVNTDDARYLADQLDLMGFDIWQVADRFVDVVLSAEELAQLRSAGYAVDLVGQGQPLRDIHPDVSRGTIPTGYLDLSQIVDSMTQTEANFPNIAKVVNLTATYSAPTTVEGRSIYAIKISDNVNSDEDEPVFLLVSNHHAREIVTPVIALDALEKLTTLYGIDPQITALVDQYEIWIAPVWNPDGYVHVFNVDNLWRKNRRVFGGGIGVDLNRNYEFGWTSGCSGSTNPSSESYKGPSANSEAETQTMIAWSMDRHFAKLLDFHSFGREVLYGYACLTHPWLSFWQSEAITLSMQSGYIGEIRAPSADGEHYQWQFGTRGTFGFLTETATSFQPTYVSAQSEASLVWPGTLHLLERPIPLWGHVRDAQTGDPIEAIIDVQGVTFPNGEQITSGGAFGRYHLFAPPGTYDLAFSANGYTPVMHQVTLDATSQQLEVIMGEFCMGDFNASTRVDMLDYVNLVNNFGQPGGIFDTNGSGLVNLDDLLLVLPLWGPCL
ncbi:MAG: hypothetical protein KDC35_17750 [Acidobacteria bacterium]|nr:hypothetical protein [Acidobacteriota bacterium]